LEGEISIGSKSKETRTFYTTEHHGGSESGERNEPSTVTYT